MKGEPGAPRPPPLTPTLFAIACVVLWLFH